MFCALLTSRYQVSVYRTNGPLVIYNLEGLHLFTISFCNYFWDEPQIFTQGAN